MKQAPAPYYPTLAEVQSRFAIWRKNKKHRHPIPEELWSAATLLTKTYSLHKVARLLSLDYTKLKKRAESLTTPALSNSLPAAPDFIPIDLIPQRDSECIIEMEHCNGNKMRMHFKGKADLDLQAIAESFWYPS